MLNRILPSAKDLYRTMHLQGGSSVGSWVGHLAPKREFAGLSLLGHQNSRLAWSLLVVGIA